MVMYDLWHTWTYLVNRCYQGDDWDKVTCATRANAFYLRLSWCFLWLVLLANCTLGSKWRACSQSTPREKNNLWSQELRVSFPCNFRIIYLIKPVWSWCACLFSLTLTAEIWSCVTLRWRKKELYESLLRKGKCYKNCHKFFSKIVLFKFQVHEKDRSQLRSTQSVGF